MSTTPRVARVATMTLVLALGAALASPAAAQSADDKRRIDDIRIALMRLPYYGVFDFLSFTYEKGTVTLKGFAYANSLKDDAEAAVRRARGVDTVVNEIEVAPASLNDDRIRRDAFYRIYTDDFLSRYAPGGAYGAYIDAVQFSRYPGTQPLGNYPIHVVVKGGRITLLGLVGNESDKQIAGVRAREVTGTFGVENELVVESRGK
ncbi:MAG: BON domain-containing protein [Acidobacteria bacterium]|nr:BON domain-containing protein [Acidobacteriota bacterium]